MNWKYKGKEVTDISQFPKDATGFVYRIEASSGKSYIGKKVIYTKRKRKFGKKEAKRVREKDRRLKLYEIVKKESNWKTYTGSNTELNNDLKGSVHVVKKEILHICKSAKQLSYYETKELFTNEVLHTDKFYNSNISGKYYKSDT